MLDILYIFLACITVFSIGLPIVIAIDKWKKEMQETDETEQADENERT